MKHIIEKEQIIELDGDKLILEKGDIILSKPELKSLHESEEYKTIMSQLGWNKLSVMIGITNPSYGDGGKSLSFRWKARSPKCNYCKITLNHKDLYDMQFGYIRGLNFTNIKDFNDVYNDQLLDVFEDYTGLATHL
jgi:hypothetical protein